MTLRSEREAKAKEFAEVKDLSSRLMRVMGMDHTRTATQTTHQNTRSRKTSDKSQLEHHIPDAKSAADSRYPFVLAATNRSEPSTKRRTTLWSPKFSVAQLPGSSSHLEECNEGINNTESRPALKELGTNHSPSKKIAVKSFPPLLHMCGELQHLDNNEPDKENADKDLDEGEYKHSFGESDFFSSTDSRQCSENNERFTTGQFDDTTVDF